MKVYESIIIFDPQTDAAAIEKIVAKIDKAIAAKGGAPLQKDDWGVKKLAYLIEKQPKGHYFFWRYAQEGTIVAAIDKIIRHEECVIRSMTVVVAKRFDQKTWDEMFPEIGLSRELTGINPGYLSVKKGDKMVKQPIDYKDTMMLSRFITEKGKIVPGRTAGVNAQVQRRLATAIKRSRQVALLSYTRGFADRSTSEDSGHGHSNRSRS